MARVSATSWSMAPSGTGCPCATEAATTSVMSSRTRASAVGSPTSSSVPASSTTDRPLKGTFQHSLRQRPATRSSSAVDGTPAPSRSSTTAATSSVTPIGRPSSVKAPTVTRS